MHTSFAVGFNLSWTVVYGKEWRGEGGSSSSINSSSIGWFSETTKDKLDAGHLSMSFC